jgi:hypothetical protein
MLNAMLRASVSNGFFDQLMSTEILKTRQTKYHHSTTIPYRRVSRVHEFWVLDQEHIAHSHGHLQRRKGVSLEQLIVTEEDVTRQTTHIGTCSTHHSVPPTEIQRKRVIKSWCKNAGQR